MAAWTRFFALRVLQAYGIGLSLGITAPLSDPPDYDVYLNGFTYYPCLPEYRLWGDHATLLAAAEAKAPPLLRDEFTTQLNRLPAWEQGRRRVRWGLP